MYCGQPGYFLNKFRITIPHDSNGNIKEAEKLCKYKDLEIEVSRIRTVRTKIVPVIIGALGTNKEGLDQNLQLIPGQLSATVTEGHTNELCTQHS